jgi:uncharacterized protein (TIGR03435 family)
MRPLLPSRILNLLTIAAVSLGLASIALAQVGSPAAPSENSEAPHKLAFDVVSIKASNPNSNESYMGTPMDGDEFQAIDLPLGAALEEAFFPMPLQRRERLVNAPSWIWNGRFDFVGKVAPADLVEWQKYTGRGIEAPNPALEAMLQSALVDRCKLAPHLVPGRADGFALVIAKQGPNAKNLVAAKSDDAIPDNALHLPLEARMVPIKSRDEPVVHFYNTSIESLTRMMSMWGAPVEDRTGLTGKYNFSIERLSTQGDPSVDWNVAPLGLRLKPIKIPIQLVVIDHIERPSPN